MDTKSKKLTKTEKRILTWMLLDLGMDALGNVDRDPDDPEHLGLLQQTRHASLGQAELFRDPGLAQAACVIHAGDPGGQAQKVGGD